jgi:hypothetical protein
MAMVIVHFKGKTMSDFKEVMKPKLSKSLLSQNTNGIDETVKIITAARE